MESGAGAVESRSLTDMDVSKVRLVLLLVLWCCKLSSSDRRSSRHSSRLLSMLRLRYRSLTAFTKRNSLVPAPMSLASLPRALLPAKRSQEGNYLDMRGRKMFYTDDTLSCCPTFTRYGPINHAVDADGMLVEVYHESHTRQQNFYMTYCVAERKGKPCSFIDPKIRQLSECVQKYSYQYAIARRWGSNEPLSLLQIRIPTGCHCEIRSPYG